MMLTVSAAPAGAADVADDLSTFVATYHCSVVELLARIHAHPHPEQMYRYLILENATDHDYVQCLFFDVDRRMLCEAESAWWQRPGEGPRFTPEQKEGLAELGFSMNGSHGNFKKYFRFSSKPDLGDVADLMLSALYTGYGARVGTGIRGDGPYAMRKALLSKNRCNPTS
jgi:hypothetical protein